MNKNYLSPNGFRLHINHIPEVKFMIQSISLPALKVTGIDIQNFGAFGMKAPGDNFDLADLTVTFIADEDLKTYESIKLWMENCVSSNNKLQMRSDAQLIIETNAKNPNFVITFTNLFPTSLSELKLSSTLSPEEPIIFTSTFALTDKFYIERKTVE